MDYTEQNRQVIDALASAIEANDTDELWLVLIMGVGELEYSVREFRHSTVAGNGCNHRARPERYP